MTSYVRKPDRRITESVALAERDLIASMRNISVAAAREAGLDEESVLSVRLAVTEALTNALKHGSPEKERSKIRLRCIACDRAFVAEVMDEGEGVANDLIEKVRAGKHTAAPGLSIILSAVDEVEFMKTESGGGVRMLKWIGGSEESPRA